MDDTQIDWDDNDDFDDEWEAEDDEDEMVLDCGVEGCLMPGEHMRSECHTVADVLRQERQGKRCPDGDWINDREPGGMECDDCGCIFISNEFRARCKVCHDVQSPATVSRDP
jgi:hypothetical protein